jgi:hypothetical protein
VRLVSFIIRIRHDARPHERKIPNKVIVQENSFPDNEHKVLLAKGSQDVEQV